MLSKITPEYLAGLIDGDGCFQLQINTRICNGRPNLRLNPRVTINLKYRNYEDAGRNTEHYKTFIDQVYTNGG